MSNCSFSTPWPRQPNSHFPPRYLHGVTEKGRLTSSLVLPETVLVSFSNRSSRAAYLVIQARKSNKDTLLAPGPSLPPTFYKDNNFLTRERPHITHPHPSSPLSKLSDKFVTRLERCFDSTHPVVQGVASPPSQRDGRESWGRNTTDS